MWDQMIMMDDITTLHDMGSYSNTDKYIANMFDNGNHKCFLSSNRFFED